MLWHGTSGNVSSREIISIKGEAQVEHDLSRADGPNFPLHKICYMFNYLKYISAFYDLGGRKGDSLASTVSPNLQGNFVTMIMG